MPFMMFCLFMLNMFPTEIPDTASIATVLLPLIQVLIHLSSQPLLYVAQASHTE